MIKEESMATENQCKDINNLRTMLQYPAFTPVTPNDLSVIEAKEWLLDLREEYADMQDFEDELDKQWLHDEYDYQYD